MNTNEKSLVVKAMGYIYTVDKDTDIIEKCVRANDNSPVRESIGNTFESYIGKSAVQYLATPRQVVKKVVKKEAVLQQVTQRSMNNYPPKQQQMRKPTNNNNKTFNKQRPQNNNKPNNKKPFNKKQQQEMKFLIPPNPVFSQSSCEATLANYIEKNPDAQRKEKFCIIASFENCIDFAILEAMGMTYFKMKPEDNIAFISVKTGNNSLTSKRNPFFPFNMPFAIDLFSRYVDVLILPANKYILKEVLKTDYKLNLFVPEKELKNEYLEVITARKNKLRKNFEKNYEKFVDEMEEYKDSSKYPNVNFQVLNKDNLVINASNIQQFNLIYN